MSGPYTGHVPPEEANALCSHIAELETELAALRHDIERHMEVTSALQTEMVDICKALGRDPEGDWHGIADDVSKLAASDGRERDAIVLEAMHELEAHEGEELLALAYRKNKELFDLRHAYGAAVAFINSHVADYDITQRMADNYHAWKELDAALSIAAPDGEGK